MERITKRDSNDTENHSGSLNNNEIYDTSAFNQLKCYENYHEDLLNEYQQIIKKMDALRLKNQMKTVTFKQLFSIKLQIEWTLMRMEKYLKK